MTPPRAAGLSTNSHVAWLDWMKVSTRSKSLETDVSFIVFCLWWNGDQLFRLLKPFGADTRLELYFVWWLVSICYPPQASKWGLDK
jgi:hypothetical protein